MKLRFLFVVLIAVWLSIQIAEAQTAKRSRRSAKSTVPTSVYYDQNYLVEVSALKFWDKTLQGYLLGAHMEYLFRLSGKPGAGWSVGAFAEAQGGGLQSKNAQYNEPAVNWEAGGVLKLSKPGLQYRLSLGYGQNYLYGKFANGLTQTLFSHSLSGCLLFHPYADRLNPKSIWFNDASLYLSGKMPLKEDKSFWAEKPVNLELLPQKISLGGELTLIDVRLSQKFMVPLGLTASYNQYDLKNSKFYTELGAFIEPYWNNRPVGRIYFNYQAGATGTHFGRSVLGISFDFGCLLDKNEPKKSSTTNRRSK